MKFVKKIVIMQGRGRGVLTLEKSGGNVNARFTSDVKTKGATLGIITRERVFVRDYSGGTINLSLECEDLSYIHAALVEGGSILLYGTCARERMWEANVLQLIWRNDALPSALLNLGAEKSLPVREEEWYGGLQLYNDRVESFLDGERVTAINERLAPTIDYSERPSLTEGEKDILLAQKVEEALELAHGVIIPRLNVIRRLDGLSEAAATETIDEGEDVSVRRQEGKTEHSGAERADNRKAVNESQAIIEVVEAESRASTSKDGSEIEAVLSENKRGKETIARGDKEESGDKSNKGNRAKARGNEVITEVVNAESRAADAHEGVTAYAATRVNSDEGSADEVQGETQDSISPKANGGGVEEAALSSDVQSEVRGSDALSEYPPAAEIDVCKIHARGGFDDNAALRAVYDRSSALSGEEEFDMSAILKYDEDGVIRPIEENGSGEPPYRTDAAFLSEYFEDVNIKPPLVPIYPIDKVKEPPRIRKATSLELHKDDVEKLFETAPRYPELEKLLPETVWVRVDMGNGMIAVGVVGGKLCYAVEGTYSPEAPASLIDPKFVPQDPARPNGKGYWLMTDKN